MRISCQSSYLREVRESQKIFSTLVNAMEKTHRAVVAGIEEKQKEEEKRVEALIKEIQQEIQELKEETSQTDLRISASQSDDMKHVAVVSVY